MDRRAVLAATLLGIPAIALAPQPDFSGAYKIDPSKSSFGDLPLPEKFERRITHSEPNLAYATHYSFQGREISSEVKYTTDGKLTTNTMDGAEVKGWASWDGDVLVIESIRQTPRGDVKMVERWSSIEGGSAIQVDAKMIGGQNEMAFKIHLAKQ